jgi:hypothetical protein
MSGTGVSIDLCLLNSDSFSLITNADLFLQKEDSSRLNMLRKQLKHQAPFAVLFAKTESSSELKSWCLTRWWLQELIRGSIALTCTLVELSMALSQMVELLFKEPEKNAPSTRVCLVSEFQEQFLLIGLPSNSKWRLSTPPTDQSALLLWWPTTTISRVSNSSWLNHQVSATSIMAVQVAEASNSAVMK